jgi:hypothetical protein
MKCPICKGKGKIDEPKGKVANNRKRMVKILIKSGFGIREIQRFVGYKSPRSVSIIKIQ